jgi:hypothetical protein
MNPVAKTARSIEDEIERPADDEVTTVPTVGNVEGEIREFVRRDVTATRRLPSAEGELGAGNLNLLIDRISGTSIQEIDHLISELQLVRDDLQAEGDRVHREVATYTQVSQAALSSAKIILDSMGQWKSAVGTIRDRG